MTEKVLYQPQPSFELDFAQKFVTSLRDQVEQSLNTSIAEVNETTHSSIEDMMRLAQRKVTAVWKKEVGSVLNEFLTMWSESLRDIPEEIYFKQLLSNTEFLEKKLEAKSIADLEGLRKINPTIWITLVNLSMMRQDQELQLIKKWAEQMSEENYDQFGFTKNHLSFALEAATEIGPLINQTYLKQMTLGFLDGVKLKDPGSKENGATSVYEVLIGKDETYQKKTYKEIFPETWPLLAQKYRDLAEKSAQMFPKKGKLFTNYLLTVADAFDCDETDFANLKKIWDKVEKMQEKLLDSDWPLNIDAAGYETVSGTFNKTDANLNVSLKTKETVLLEKKYGTYAQVAQEILTSHDENNKQKMKATSLNVILAGFGSHTWWINQGEADVRAICYTNSIETVNALGVSDAYQKLVRDNENEEDKKELLEIMVLATTLHEMGHTFFPLEKKVYADRIGYYSSHAELTDELKADTTGIRIFWEKEKEQGETKRARKFLEFMLAYSQEYIETDANEEQKMGDYKKMAIIMLSAMMKNGGIRKEKEGYTILNVTKSFEAIVNLSEIILNKYANPKTKPNKIAAFVENLTNTSLEEFNGTNDQINTQTIPHSQPSPPINGIEPSLEAAAS